jgi:hypothetical protein
MAILRKFIFLVMVAIFDGRSLGLSATILKENYQRTFITKFGNNWSCILRVDVESRYFYLH